MAASILVLVFLLELFGISMASYSCCIANFLNLNSSCLENKTLDYSYSILTGILYCDTENGLSLLKDDCITVNSETTEIEVGQCMYNHGKGNDDNFAYYYIPIPANTSDINDYSCSKYNRAGTLCGKCQDGHYPFVYSLNLTCTECPNRKSNWWKFVLATFLPLTLFYFLILFFKINITSSYLQGFVLCCQVVSMPAIARTIVISIPKLYIVTLYRVIGGLCAIWNLDMLRFAFV